LKTVYSFKNQMWSICTCIGLWVQAKKNGVIKGPFLQPPGIVTQNSKIFACISLQKLKYFENIFGIGSIDTCKKPEFENLIPQSL